MSNIMIGAVAKRISSKFNEGDRVKIAKEYGGGTGKVVDVVGSFVVVKTKKGNESYHSSDLKVINGIGATTALRRSFLSSAEYQKAKKLKNFKAENYKWDPTNQLYKKIK